MRGTMFFTGKSVRIVIRVLLAVAVLVVAGILIWQGVTAQGNPNPVAPNTSPAAATLDIGVLVFREGLESILVLAAIVASMTGERQSLRKPVVAGAFVAFLATVVTWFVAVGIVSNLQQSVSALSLQAATGLLAVIVLLVVMNWFFHKIYWGGWIAMHNRNKRKLLASSDEISSRRLGGDSCCSVLRRFTARVSRWCCSCKPIICNGAEKLFCSALLLGLFFTGIVAALTFVAHRKLPYRKMLVLTGVLLGLVLLVMVGEQAQEMQLAPDPHDAD